MDCLEKIRVKYPQFNDLELKEIQHTFDQMDALEADAHSSIAKTMDDFNKRNFSKDSARLKAEKQKENALIRLERGLNQIKSRRKIIERVLHPNFHNNSDQAVLSLLTNTTRNVPNKFVNYDAIFNSKHSQGMDYFNSALDSIEGAKAFLESPDNQRKLVEFMYDGMKDSKADKTMVEIADAIASVNSYLFDDLRNAGSYIGRKKDYIIPQTHNTNEILGRISEWKEFMLKNLDVDATVKQFDFSAYRERSKDLRSRISKVREELADIREATKAHRRPKTLKDSKLKRQYEKDFIKKQFLQSQLDDLKSSLDDVTADEADLISRMKDDPNSDFKQEALSAYLDKHIDSLRDMALEGRVADKFGRRAFIFKDGSGFYDYMTEFGHGSLIGNVYRNIENTTRQTALVTVAGDTPLDNINWTMRKLNNIRRFSGQDNNAFTRTNRVLNMIKGVNRKWVNPDGGLLTLKPYASFQRNVYTPWKYIAQLGSAPVTGLNDLTQIVTTAVTETGENVLSSGIRNTLQAMANLVGGKDKLRELAKTMGNDFDTIHLEGMNQFTDIETNKNHLSPRILNGYFKFIGMEAQTRIARATATQDAHRKLKLALRNPEMNNHVRQFLDNFGFSDSEFNIVKEVAEKGGDIDIETIAGLDLPHKVRRDLITKVTAYYNKNMGASSPNPDLNTMASPLIQGDLPPDTLGGILMHFVGTYKKAYIRSLNTVEEMIRASNPEGKLFPTEARYNTMKNLAQVTVFGIVVAGLVESLKQFATTGEVKLDSRFIQTSVSNSGMSAVALELAMLATTSRDPDSVIKYLIGPVYQDVAQVVKTIRTATGNRNFNESDLKYIMRSIPANNAFLIRAFNEHVTEILPSILTEPSKGSRRQR